MSELQGLQSRMADFRSSDTRVIAVSPDSVEQNKKVVEWLDLDFPVLSDAELVATSAFGVRHPGASPSGGDIPRPATYIISGGAVRWRNLTENWRIRPRPSDILTVLSTISGSN